MSVDIGDVEMIIDAKIKQLIDAIEKVFPYDGARIVEEFRKANYFKTMKAADVEQSAFDPIVDPDRDYSNVLTKEDVDFDFYAQVDEQQFNFKTEGHVADTEEFEAALVKNPHLFIGDDYVDLKDFYVKTAEDCSEEGIQKLCDEVDQQIEEFHKFLSTMEVDAEIEELDRKRAEWNKNYELAMSNLKG